VRSQTLAVSGLRSPGRPPVPCLSDPGIFSSSTLPIGPRSPDDHPPSCKIVGAEPANTLMKPSLSGVWRAAQSTLNFSLYPHPTTAHSVSGSLSLPCVIIRRHPGKSKKAESGSRPNIPIEQTLPSNTFIFLLILAPQIPASHPI
jgi:hypothetical protein